MEPISSSQESVPSQNGTPKPAGFMRRIGDYFSGSKIGAFVTTQKTRAAAKKALAGRDWFQFTRQFDLATTSPAMAAAYTPAMIKEAGVVLLKRVYFDDLAYLCHVLHNFPALENAFVPELTKRAASLLELEGYKIAGRLYYAVQRHLAESAFTPAMVESIANNLLQEQYLDQFVEFYLAAKEVPAHAAVFTPAMIGRQADVFVRQGLAVKFINLREIVADTPEHAAAFTPEMIRESIFILSEFRKGGDMIVRLYEAVKGVPEQEAVFAETINARILGLEEKDAKEICALYSTFEDLPKARSSIEQAVANKASAFLEDFRFGSFKYLYESARQIPALEKVVVESIAHHAANLLEKGDLYRFSLLRENIRELPRCVAAFTPEMIEQAAAACLDEKYLNGFIRLHEAVKGSPEQQAVISKFHVACAVVPGEKMEHGKPLRIIFAPQVTGSEGLVCDVDRRTGFSPEQLQAHWIGRICLDNVPRNKSITALREAVEQIMGETQIPEAAAAAQRSLDAMKKSQAQIPELYA